MKYYNRELERIRRNHFDEKALKELLGDIKKSIENSTKKIKEVEMKTD
ncbi:MAG: hypothetical protein ACRD5E_11450 [Nitrososphaeraceae archaeon]